MDYDKIRYKNKYYAVMRLRYKKKLDLPIVLDWDDFQKIHNMNKRWKCNNNGFIYCIHTYNSETKEVFLHDIIMALKLRKLNQKGSSKAILHINRLGMDNREDNLIYDTVDKETNKNIKKKRRIITLPEESGINVEEIPTYVWYMKPNGKHGDRFMIEIGNINWKTTSSKSVSLKYKLEEAKLFLRELRKTKPELFAEYSMNGDFTAEGQKLLEAYYTIIHRAGYNHIKNYVPKNNTQKMLKENVIDTEERQLLRQQNNLMDILNNTGDRKRRLLSNIPAESGIKSSDLPKYCYYRRAYENHGDYFIIENHPQLGGKTWATSSSKNVSLQEKYEELLDYLDDL